MYRHFRATAEWPQAWRVERDFEEDLEHNGGLTEVCRSLGEAVICESITQVGAQLKLRLKGLSLIDKAAIDIDAYLTLCRFAAQAYNESETQPVQITLTQFIAFSGVDELLARRAFQIATLDGRFWSGGGATNFQLNNFAPKLANVTSIAEAEASWNRYWERNFKPSPSVRSVLESPPTPVSKYFLSHAAADGKAAQYIANLIRAADKNAEIFVASVPGHIQTGDDWLASIRSELKAAHAYIVLLSERSVRRPWIWFETGAAWFSGRQLVPLVLPGLLKSSVPMPLAAHQMLSLDSEREVEQFFLDLRLATPDLSAVVAALREICSVSRMSADAPSSIDVAAT